MPTKEEIKKKVAEDLKQYNKGLEKYLSQLNDIIDKQVVYLLFLS